MILGGTERVPAAIDVPVARQSCVRPSIADLYSWRYRELGNLPNVLTDERQIGEENSGFKSSLRYCELEFPLVVSPVIGNPPGLVIDHRIHNSDR